MVIRAYRNTVHKMKYTSKELHKNSQKQAQLRNPFNERQLRFTRDGYSNLKNLQASYEEQLGRKISESVALDIILTNKCDNYCITATSR